MSSLRSVLRFAIPIVVAVLILGTATSNAPAESPGILELRNAHVLRRLENDNGSWRTTLFARADGSDPLPVDSDEFHILPLEETIGVTVADYEAIGVPEIQLTRHAGQTLRIAYRARPGLPDWAPLEVVVKYTLGAEPYLRKTIELTMSPNGIVDRLTVERFSTATTATRGGRGEPIFLDDWFCGVEYPAACTRHSDGFEPRPYGMVGNYSWIGYDGRDAEFEPREGLVSMFHFPGYAHEDPENQEWKIESKTSVFGVGKPGDSIELTFLDYLDTIRLPVRSFIHYNNWYDGSGKDLSIANFAERVARDFRVNLDPYGVRVDAMVPDNGWQNGQSIYQPNASRFPGGTPELALLSDALKAEGTRLGLWMSLNGYASINRDWALSQGMEGATPNERFERFKSYLCIASPNYGRAIRERLPELIEACDVAYIKHDFNEMCCIAEGHGHLATDRHGHEASVDVELEVLALERSVQPEIYQNVTNWVWFSPWWLSHGNNLWMLSGDSGTNNRHPQISTRQMAITYRDSHLFQMWGDPETRPLVPISHLMTHGIIYGDRKLTEKPGDTLRDWSDYVVMYYGRGLQLKEWYITTSMMTPDRWKVLGRATRWSEENLTTLANTVYVGGDPAEGAAYGYAAFEGDRGILVLRNPDLMEQTIDVPFDQTTLYRGPSGRAFQGNIVYPTVKFLGGRILSGEPIRVRIPAWTTMVVHLEPEPSFEHLPSYNMPWPKRALVDSRQNDESLTLELQIPDEAMDSCLLMLQASGEPVVTINGETRPLARDNQGAGWALYGYDLREDRGTTATVVVTAPDGTAPENEVFPSVASEVRIEKAYLLWDRPRPYAEDEPFVDSPELPWPIAQEFVRESFELLGDVEPIALTPVASGAAALNRSISDADLQNIQAAKLRIRVFGSNGGSYADKPLTLNGERIGQVPSNTRGDNWEEVVLDLPEEALELIRRSNEIRIGNVPGDKYKASHLALAVQRTDGTWVTSSSDARVHASSDDWRYAEGVVFETPELSAPIVLEFVDLTE
jgi:hypothetical protein